MLGKMMLQHHRDKRLSALNVRSFSAPVTLHAVSCYSAIRVIIIGWFRARCEVRPVMCEAMPHGVGWNCW